MEKLLKASLLFFFANLTFYFFNYVFHFGSARMLGPVDYGTLAALMSFLYLFTIPSETIQTTLAKYTTKFKIKKQEGKIKALLKRASKKFFLYSFFVFLFLLALLPFLAKFFHTSIIPIFILYSTIFFFFLLPITRGILQGMQRFKELGLNMIIEGITKVFLAILLVYFGLKVSGAMTAVVASLAMAFVFSFFPIKDITRKKEKRIETKQIYSYSLPVLIAVIATTIFYSIDIILAKHFLPAEQAGFYAVVSLLGKIVFFATMPITKVMFPFVAEKHEKKIPHTKILKKSFLYVLIISIFFIIAYFLFPNFIIKIFFGKAFLEASLFIKYSAVAFSFLSFSYLFCFYNLSRERKKSSFVLMLFCVLQLILLNTFHSTIQQFLFVITTTNFFMFLVLLLNIKK